MTTPGPQLLKPQQMPWSRIRRLLAIGLLAALAVSAWLGFWRYHLKRFDTVQAGVLYRSGQPTEFGLRHVIARHEIRTVLSIRLDDEPLHRGLFDLGEPDGEIESVRVPQMGPRHLHWPMDNEAYWPWLTPTMFEDFFELMDNPANWPVLVHCLGGRHRTGTFSALFQLEYSRRPIDDALREMYSFGFGDPAALQEHNLRTYWPRPLPNARQWRELQSALLPSDSYRALVRRLASVSPGDEVFERVERYIAEDRPFAVCLAQRFVNRPDHRLAATATALAVQTLEQQSPGEQDDRDTLASAAALVADYGDLPQQRRLLELLEIEAASGTPSPRYEAIVVGVTNRYTPNRISFLIPLLKDSRLRTDPALSRYRYCDTAAARLTSITNEPLHNGMAPRECWDAAVANCLRWVQSHPESCQLSTLLPPLDHGSLRKQVARETDERKRL